MSAGKRWGLLAVLVLTVGAFFALGLSRYLSLEFIKSQQGQLEAWRAANPLVAALTFFGIYIATTALSLPGATILTLTAGAIFGLGWGSLIVSFAASIGATLAFLISRMVLRDWVQARFGERLAAINDGVRKDGAFYLFTLRVVPLFPFFLVNLAMGLTSIRALTFYGVSQLGMLPGTLVYVNAGTQLARIDKLADVASPGVLASLALLGHFPLIAKKGIDLFRARQELNRGLAEDANSKDLELAAGARQVLTSQAADRA